MEKEIENLVIPYGYKIYSFEYYPKVFGNMVLKLAKSGTIITFVTDRGEIFYNDSIIRDGSYHKTGVDDTFKELMIIIKNILTKKLTD